jgi:hypothetical protein
MTERRIAVGLAACVVGIWAGMVLMAAPAAGAAGRRGPATTASTSANATTKTGTTTRTAATAKATASSRAATGAADGLGIHADVERVSMDLPGAWGMNIKSDMLLESHPPAPDKDATGQYQASLAIRLGTLNKAPPDAVTLGTAEQAARAKQEPGYQVLEKPAAVTIGGLSGVKFAGSFKRGGAEVRSREYLLLAGNNEVYMIQFSSLNSQWPGYQNLIERSVATFKPKKKK